MHEASPGVWCPVEGLNGCVLEEGECLCKGDTWRGRGLALRGRRGLWPYSKGPGRNLGMYLFLFHCYSETPKGKYIIQK